MRRALFKKQVAALAALAAGVFAPAAGATPKPVNPDWPPIPMDEELFGDNPELVARTSGFVQSFYECLSSCSVDEQLGYLRFPTKIVLPSATIRDAAQYRAAAERARQDVADPDHFVNTFKATGDEDNPLVHVTVLSSGTHRATGESFRFLTDEQLQLTWNDDTSSYVITRYQINTMAPA
ncbi:MAG: hypothetical protein ACRC20_03785 [Segniliparus sp.]|uniref:hypothetical protein n=1 Tax=Segniliparus sp. TaxID=2804064 RepID=UPI003F3750AE